MPLVSIVSPEEATGKTAEIYADIQKVLGRVPNALQMWSASPTMLELAWAETGYFMRHPRLSPQLLTVVRMLVSQENECAYCIGFNAGLLIGVYGFTPEQVAMTKKAPSQAPLDEKDKALLLFILKAVKTPLQVVADDVQKLQELGWSEMDIFEAVTHGSRNVAADLIFNTFKLENDF
ncbi:carboxymuconolactone decarboxylase family protein [Beggiatoa leptomitoformis]|uniref:Carboxymuconolactone decarboxylase family protein n=1 Tax=Beggiatoa leptomitoformis TaxID=288004 RepID=A0A2N9YJ62_9GAMM|nr:carboxymuconolactone decarboxylase family protein [Beggiatoa leptomitoformis]ALG67394.1 hypothetical protein AL038_06360 [Beggiatoa leptomitoformis]AUI70395.1 hypothetical protein BLE401_17945 [Beggiatoa leptomitoformis]